VLIFFRRRSCERFVSSHLIVRDGDANAATLCWLQRIEKDSGLKRTGRATANKQPMESAAVHDSIVAAFSGPARPPPTMRQPSIFK